MVSLSTSGVKLLPLLGSPVCHPLLPPLFRWSRKLLASSGLLERSCFSSSSTPTSDVRKTHCCSELVQLTCQQISTLAQRENIILLSVDGVSGCDTSGASDSVPIAGDDRGDGTHWAAARAAKEEFSFLISRRHLSLQACTLLVCVVTSDCIA